MKFKEFNKIGDTSFRVKSQVTGYAQVAEFLLGQYRKNDNKEIKIDDLNDQFKTFCKKEQIYNYDNDKAFGKGRFKFILSLFKKIGAVRYIKTFVIIDNSILEKIVDNPHSFLFKSFNLSFDFFKCGINTLLEYSKMDEIAFISALQVVEIEKEEFIDVYNSFKLNYYETVKSLVFDLYNSTTFENFKIDNFINQYKKKSKNLFYEVIEKIMIALKENKPIDDHLIDKIESVDKGRNLIKNLIKLKEFGPRSKKRISNKQMRDLYKNYFNNINYNDFFIDINIAKIYANIGRDYYDLMWRWLNDFNLINDNYVVEDYITRVDESFNIKDVQNVFNCYPYTIEEIKSKLEMIAEEKFDFKKNDENIKDIENSTLAEYFVNIYYAIILKLDPNEFVNCSRTKLKPGTLFPIIHAPGKGPDMYFVEKNKNKIIAIETTIHKTIKTVINNEVYAIIDHVNLEKINNYIKDSEIAKNIKNTQIILVSPLTKQEEIDEVKDWIETNYTHKSKACYGIEKSSCVLNFKMLANDENGLN